MASFVALQGQLTYETSLFHPKFQMLVQYVDENTLGIFTFVDLNHTGFFWHPAKTLEEVQIGLTLRRVLDPDWVVFPKRFDNINAKIKG